MRNDIAFNLGALHQIDALDVGIVGNQDGCLPACNPSANVGLFNQRAVQFGEQGFIGAIDAAYVGATAFDFVAQ